MEALVLQGFNALLLVVTNVFNMVFFWLPVDPLAEYLDSVSLAQAAPQALRWLNWFVDVRLFAGVFSAFVTVMLAFAVFKVFMAVIRIIRDAVEAVPVIE